MDYIIFDLEWNNAYNYKTQRGINEIVEIGAVKMNSRLEIVDTYKQLIKPSIAKKLGSRFKRLTHITNEEIKANGVSFDEAFNGFSSWCGKGDNLFLSWSTSDIYTLVGNFKLFKKTADIGFITKYADAQKYCMSFLENDNNQISLSKCAELFEINVDEYSFHRALEDCVITALCFKKVFDGKKLQNYIHSCDVHYFEKLVFKPYFIKTPEYKDFKLGSITFDCPLCHKTIRPIIDYEFINNTFRGVGACDGCKKKFWIYVRAKQNYDNISVSRRVVLMNKKRAKHIN